MDHSGLAELLICGEHAERVALLAWYPALAKLELARVLKDMFFAHESSDPARAVNAAASLALLAQHNPDPEIQALAAWLNGVTARLADGQLEASIVHLDEAAARFHTIDQPHAAAATQVSKLVALAMLGRYDEAIIVGLQARDVLVAHHDHLTAGKIEQNLGNIYLRRDSFAEAIDFYRAAEQRFIVAGKTKELAQIYNNLARALTWQYQFRAAAQYYEQALALAASAGLTIIEAEIECNLGELALFQGQYDRALDYLERSRRCYAVLAMHHELATVELELADAYLELNLAPEAAAMYGRLGQTFGELGMRAEQARAQLHHGRAAMQLGRMEEARAFLIQAHGLYIDEGNQVGAAIATVCEAHSHYQRGNYHQAIDVVTRAETLLAAANSWGWLLFARWLHGDAARALGQHGAARLLIEATLGDAEQQLLPPIVLRCYTSLGLLCRAEGDAVAAEVAFTRAVALSEQLRAPLPAEEFQTAFVADKLVPYAELVRLCLEDVQHDRFADTFDYLERARSQALIALLGGTVQAHVQPRDGFETQLVERLEELRAELNWFYSQLNHSAQSAELRPTALAELQHGLQLRETAIAEMTRQLQQRSYTNQSTDGAAGAATALPATGNALVQLQVDLGHESVLVEYFFLDDEVLAFVATNVDVVVVRRLARVEQVDAAVTDLRFQLDTLRYGVELVGPHLNLLVQRAQYHLHTLYDLLLRPLEQHLGQRRLVVAPYRMLHYVPFHALYDGSQYLIERRELCYTPSAAVLHHCLSRPERPLQRAVLLGVPDAQIPRVRDEVFALAPLFPEAVMLVDENATVPALRAAAVSADLLHLACHGVFRPDNPLFSSLQLSDGWLTVRDAYSLGLDCGLVTLSACETGLSAVAPGDELLGIARGFLSAGASSLLVSLWTVDDESTAALMHTFYTELCRGQRPAAALRIAQRDLMQRYPHPFFWSPFVLLGRW